MINLLIDPALAQQTYQLETVASQRRVPNRSSEIFSNCIRRVIELKTHLRFKKKLP